MFIHLKGRGPRTSSIPWFTSPKMFLQPNKPELNQTTARNSSQLSSNARAESISRELDWSVDWSGHPARASGTGCGFLRSGSARGSTSPTLRSCCISLVQAWKGLFLLPIKLFSWVLRTWANIFSHDALLCAKLFFVMKIKLDCDDGCTVKNIYTPPKKNPLHLTLQMSGLYG